MITIEIMGGLGNQLFQVFNLISYCLTNRVPFYFEYKESPDRADRPFYWDTFLSNLKPFVKLSFDRSVPIYREQGFHFTDHTPYSLIKKPFKFFRYFQSYKYFQEKEQDIFRMIGLEKTAGGGVGCSCGIMRFRAHNFDAFFVSGITNINNKTIRWQAFHIMKRHFSALSIARNELTGMSCTSMRNRTMIWLPTESTYWREQFKHLTFTPINTDIADYEQILLMASCAHNIIANSSFSWWGARFNQREDKVVTYPKEWFGPALGKKRLDDMCCEEWHCI